MTNNTENNAIKLYNGQPVTNGITTGVEERKQRGLIIAAVAKIEKQNGVYLVPSQTSPRHQKYKVRYDAKNPTCDCPDFHERGCRCKHVYAVEYFRQREISADGVETVTESITITQKRKTYPQNWPAYDAAQTNEKRHFQALLADLCKTIEEPAQDMSKGGRPRLPLADAVYSAIFKIYSTMNARRFVSDLCDAQAKGYIQKVPHFSSVLKALENADLFPILVKMIERSAQHWHRWSLSSRSIPRASHSAGSRDGTISNTTNSLPSNSG